MVLSPHSSFLLVLSEPSSTHIDLHSICFLATSDTEKVVNQGWGADKGDAELIAEVQGAQDAQKDAAAEGWGAPAVDADAWGAAAGETPAAAAATGDDAEKEGARKRREEEEEEDNTITLEEYLAKKKAEESAIPKLEGRTVETSDFKDAVQLLREDSKEVYFAGKVCLLPFISLFAHLIQLLAPPYRPRPLPRLRPRRKRKYSSPSTLLLRSARVVVVVVAVEAEEATVEAVAVVVIVVVTAVDVAVAATGTALLVVVPPRTSTLMMSLPSLRFRKAKPENYTCEATKRCDVHVHCIPQTKTLRLRPIIHSSFRSYPIIHLFTLTSSTSPLKNAKDIYCLILSPSPIVIA